MESRISLLKRPMKRIHVERRLAEVQPKSELRRELAPQVGNLSVVSPWLSETD